MRDLKKTARAERAGLGGAKEDLKGVSLKNVLGFLREEVGSDQDEEEEEGGEKERKGGGGGERGKDDDEMRRMIRSLIDVYEKGELRGGEMGDGEDGRGGMGEGEGRKGGDGRRGGGYAGGEGGARVDGGVGGGLASEDKMRSVGLSEEQVQIAKVMGLTNEDVDEYARRVDEDPQSLEFDLGGGAQDLAPVGAEEMQEGGLASLVNSGDSLLGGMGGASVLARIEEYIKEEKQEREFLGEIKEAGEATSQGPHSMTIHGSLGYKRYKNEVSRSGAASHGPYSITFIYITRMVPSMHQRQKRGQTLNLAPQAPSMH